MTDRPRALTRLARVLPPPGLSTPTGFRALALVNLALLWVIVPSGALVRLTGSGLGCPDWPLCDGGVVPESGAHAAIEFGNRVFSAVVMATAVLTWLAARRMVDPPTALRRLAMTAALMTVGQVPLGGLTVLSDLHPLMVSSHFLLSMAALAVGSVLAVAACDHAAGRSRGWSPRRGPFAIATAAALGTVLVTGVLVTAAGPHSGDPDVIERYGDLQDATWIHVRAVAVLVVLLAVLAVWLWRERPADPAARPLMGVALALLAVQITLGEVQYRRGLPWEVVAAHVSVAGLLWATGVAVAVLVARPPLPVRDAHGAEHPTSTAPVAAGR